jgi:hypothetical protein
MNVRPQFSLNILLHFNFPYRTRLTYLILDVLKNAQNCNKIIEQLVSFFQTDISVAAFFQIFNKL